ncbi:MAG: hypothetical protein WC301_06555 [Candidatus Omnitrophota bacterium]|jgi:uncharacterized protein (UPF0333 family)
MLNRKGQSTLEYALIIAVVVAGLLLMQHYVKRGYSGRLRSAADDMGEQYDPTTYSSSITHKQSTDFTEKVKDGVTTKEYTEDVTSKTGSETVGAWQENEKLFRK